MEFVKGGCKDTERRGVERRRGDGGRERKTKYENARSPGDLLEPCKKPEPVALADVVALMGSKLRSKAKKYPGANVDILVYVNLSNKFLNPKFQWPEVGHLKEFGWRSISFVFPPYGGVVIAGESAPTFLRDSKGKVRAGYDHPDQLFEL